MTPGSPPGSVFSMEKAKILPLPGNSSREGTFYEEQHPSVNAPVGPTGLPLDQSHIGGARIDQEQPLTPYPTAPDPLPFKIGGQ